MNKKEKELQYKTVKSIIRTKNIYAVYQPIVCMATGKVYGYEALARIKDQESNSIGIEELFAVAEKNGMVWGLEAICRKKALKGAKVKPKDKKLFINVNPNVLLDAKFKSGTTAKYVKKYGLEPKDIVFEITERTPIRSKNAFKKTLNHYTLQNYSIAIDDFGSAYAGLDRLCYIIPEYLKLDAALIRDIQEDPLRISLIKHMIQFCKENDIKVIAEGIETKQEADVLKHLGVDFGQGYYFAKPSVEFVELMEEN